MTYSGHFGGNFNKTSKGLIACKGIMKRGVIPQFLPGLLVAREMAVGREAARRDKERAPSSGHVKFEMPIKPPVKIASR